MEVHKRLGNGFQAPSRHDPLDLAGGAPSVTPGTDQGRIGSPIHLVQRSVIGSVEEILEHARDRRRARGHTPGCAQTVPAPPLRPGQRAGMARTTPAGCGPLADTTRTARDSTVSGNPPLTHRASHLDFPPLRGALSPILPIRPRIASGSDCDALVCWPLRLACPASGQRGRRSPKPANALRKVDQ